MKTDIVCAEAELSIAVNNIVEYADFLSRTIEAYISVLAEIQEKGVQDELVCSKLSAIAQSLKPYKISVKEECDNFAADVRKYITEVSDADNFKFPMDITSTITSIVSRFI